MGNLLGAAGLTAAVHRQLRRRRYTADVARASCPKRLDERPLARTSFHLLPFGVPHMGVVQLERRFAHMDVRLAAWGS